MYRRKRNEDENYVDVSTLKLLYQLEGVSIMWISKMMCVPLFAYRVMESLNCLVFTMLWALVSSWRDS